MKFRKSAPTLKNDSSSRTHAVCRIRVVNKDVRETADGLLFLIDLAGSEAAADIKEHSKERMKEAREINTSLSTLKVCIRGRSMWSAEQNQAAGRSKPAHIPYRNSALTKVLKHVFDTKGHRHCKTAVVACISSSFVDIAPTKNTCRYAEMLKIPFPPFILPPYQGNVPSTWSAAALRKWIEGNVSFLLVECLRLVTLITNTNAVGRSSNRLIFSRTNRKWYANMSAPERRICVSMPKDSRGK